MTVGSDSAEADGQPPLAVANLPWWDGWSLRSLELEPAGGQGAQAQAAGGLASVPRRPALPRAAGPWLGGPAAAPWEIAAGAVP